MYLIKQFSASGKVRWLQETDPIKWSFAKKRATKFRSYETAKEYIEHMGIEFYTIVEASTNLARR
jgi:hypothetical protein